MCTERSGNVFGDHPVVSGPTNVFEYLFSMSYTDIPLPFVIFAHFSELFLLFLMICISSLYNILPAVFIENLFSKFVTCYFTFFGVSFDDRKFPILIKSGVPLFY